MTKATEKQNNLDKGHRQRLREYIIKNYDTLTKEKVFEYFLCMAIPRKDVRLLAKTILDKVNGNVNSLMNKDYNCLKNSLELSDAVIAAIFTFKKIMSFCNEEELIENLKLNSITKLAKYFQNEIGSRETEYIMVLFLNSGQKLIERKIFGDKNSALTTINISEIITIALNNNARYLVMSHNHPSGNVKPSQSDKIATSAFEETIKNINKFELIDHIIVGKNDYYSFSEHGLLKRDIYRSNTSLKYSDVNNGVSFNVKKK